LHRYAHSMPTQSDAKLRAEIRLLGNLLGQTLVRQEGQGLLDLVERVRALAKEIRREAGDAANEPRMQLLGLLADLDLGTVIALVRAFTTYFYLANVAEQTHRLDHEAIRRTEDHGILGAAVDRIERGNIEADLVQAVAARLEVRPVFTAHPTEAARRSIRTKIIRLAELLQERGDPRLNEAALARTERHLA
jgi:phosphoenolpyruvate carboxylase